MAQIVPFIPMIIQAVGTIASMAGGVAQASQAQQQSKDEVAAIQAQKRAADAAAEKQEIWALAKNQARTEAGGVASGSGSPLEFELLNAYTSGENRAWNRYAYDLQKRQAQWGGINARSKAGAALWEGIGDFASIGGKWYKASQTP